MLFRSLYTHSPSDFIGHHISFSACIDDLFLTMARSNGFPITIIQIGHAIGLGHNNDDDSCLGPFNSRNNQVLNKGPGEDDIRVLDKVLYRNAVISGGGNAGPAPTPLLIQPKPTNKNIFSGSETLVEVRNGDCTAKECGKCMGKYIVFYTCQQFTVMFSSSSRSSLLIIPPTCPSIPTLLFQATSRMREKQGEERLNLKVALAITT